MRGPAAKDNGGMVRNRAGGDATWARINAPLGMHGLDKQPAVDGWGRERGRHARRRAKTRAQHLRAEAVAKGALACALSGAVPLFVVWILYVYVSDLVERGGY